MVDAVRLDYEMKTFLSTLDFAKSLNKTSFYQPGIFKDSISGVKASELQVNITATGYHIKRGTQEVFTPHKLPEGFSINREKGMRDKIYFSQSNNGHLKITSRQNFNRYIIFDSVGRWRGDITAPK